MWHHHNKRFVFSVTLALAWYGWIKWQGEKVKHTAEHNNGVQLQPVVMSGIILRTKAISSFLGMADVERAICSIGNRNRTFVQSLHLVSVSEFCQNCIITRSYPWLEFSYILLCRRLPSCSFKRCVSALKYLGWKATVGSLHVRRAGTFKLI